MSAEPLKSMGYWSGKEKAVEGVLPFTISGFAFYHLSGLMGSVSAGKQLTDLEVYIYLGALACLVAWTVSRQMFLFGRRKVLTIGVSLWVLPWESFTDYLAWWSPTLKKDAL